MPDYPNFSGLTIAVPHTGRYLPAQFTWAFANLHPPMNYNTRYVNTYKMPVDTARNLMAEQAVQHKSKYLLFIDEDVILPPHALRQLIFTAEHRPDAGAIAGIYCHKAKPPMPMVFRGNGGGPYWDWKLGEVFEITGSGMGCTLIRVEVFMNIEKPWFKSVDDMSSFLDGVNFGQLWTEDLYFYKKLTDAGYKAYADSNVLCDHWDLDNNIGIGLPINSKPMQGVKTKGKKIVDLGAGEFPYETDEGTVTTVDIREEVHPDYRCDLRQLPFAAKEFDIVHSSHTLEHFSREEVPNVLKEWVRILKDDGELRLIIPNVGWAAEQIVNGKMEDPDLKPHILNVLYGAQSYGENFHKMGFTPDLLGSMIKQTGLKHIESALDGYNIFIRARRKPPKVKEEKVKDNRGWKKKRKWKSDSK